MLANKIRETVSWIFRYILERVTHGSEDIRLKLKAKIILSLLTFLILYALFGTLFATHINIVGLVLLFLVYLIELLMVTHKLSGYLVVFFTFVWHVSVSPIHEDILKYEIYLAVTPMVCSVFVSNKKIFVFILIWILFVIKYYSSDPSESAESQNRHKKTFWALLVTSIVTTIVSELPLAETAKEARKIQLKNQGLYQLNKELLETKEKTVKYSEELKLTVEKLEISNKTLEQAVNAKRNFITKVSDELINPINSIMGNLELLEDVPMDRVIREKLISVKWSAEILLQMANNIIDASKIQIGAVEINKKKTSVKIAFEKLWALSCQKMEQKSIRGLLYLSKNMPKYLVLDEEKVIEVCHNMLTNSVKYTERGNIKVFVTWFPRDSNSIRNTFNNSDGFYSLSAFCKTVRTTVKCTDSFTLLDISESLDLKQIPDIEEKKEEKLALIEDTGDSQDNFNVNFIPSSFIENKKGFLVLNSLGSSSGLEENPDQTPLNKVQKGDLKIEIIDSGCGMDTTIFPLLCKSIFHTDSKLTQQLGGKGLGIYVSTELVRLMGGEIRYFTKKGVGTSIIVKIPTEIPQQYQNSGTFLSYLSAMTLDTKKIALVVDDDKMNREILTAYLKKFNIFTLHAENGAEAVEIFKQKPDGYFCFITMDLQMPVLDGIEAIKKIREIETIQERKARVKIVVITANCTEQDKDEVTNPKKACRADMFFRKPLTMNDCQNFVEEFMSCKNFLT